MDFDLGKAWDTAKDTITGDGMATKLAMGAGALGFMTGDGNGLSGIFKKSGNAIKWAAMIGVLALVLNAVFGEDNAPEPENAPDDTPTLSI